MLSSQRERRIVMIKSHVAPPAWVVTGTTVRSELSVMSILCSVTGKTIRGRSLIHSVDVTCLALNTGMFARKRETRVVVIEGHIRPFCRFMTRTAARAKLAIVSVLCRMAGVTILRRTFEYTIHMTA